MQSRYKLFQTPIKTKETNKKLTPPAEPKKLAASEEPLKSDALEEGPKEPEEPITIIKKETVVMENKQIVVVENDKKRIIPPPYGHKVSYIKDFEEQKWGQEVVSTTQKTRMGASQLNYEKSWR